jgi:hypothetical protein
MRIYVCMYVCMIHVYNSFGQFAVVFMDTYVRIHICMYVCMIHVYNSLGQFAVFNGGSVVNWY